MRINADALLLQAVTGESGRTNGEGYVQSAKHVADSSVWLTLQVAKFVRDPSVSCASLASDTEDERYVTNALHTAQVAIDQARERVTALYIAALKDAGRLPR